ncbi:multiprotein-bridging factor 1 family protein [Altericista sp. CCNU0014]|uniref:helix-turn-helix domain-containing protein n=1 Tax=Altericista sp. CCNU0014 TaxID=3082949 RepID=UPI00384AFA22
MAFHQEYLGVQQPAIGQLIRELRQTLGLTQEKLAAQLGLTFPTINRWENGHAKPSRLALRQIDTLLRQMSESSNITLQEHSQVMRRKYLSSKELEV